jgi:hypothetical protein
LELRYTLRGGTSGSVIGDVNASKFCEPEKHHARTGTANCDVSVTLVNPAHDEAVLVIDDKNIAGVIGELARGRKDRNMGAEAVGSATAATKLNCLQGAVGRDDFLQIVVLAKDRKREPNETAADSDEHNANANKNGDAAPEGFCRSKCIRRTGS